MNVGDRIALDYLDRMTDLIDKYQAGSVLFGGVEEIAYPRCADTHEHFNKIGTRHGKEWNIGFTSNGFGQ